jgi:hypothetical protein
MVLLSKEGTWIEDISEQGSESTSKYERVEVEEKWR